MPAVQVPHRARKRRNRRKASAERVREMLREVAFVLHATRVVGRIGEGVAAKEKRELAAGAVAEPFDHSTALTRTATLRDVRSDL
jgi:hypothetical protein